MAQEAKLRSKQVWYWCSSYWTKQFTGLPKNNHCHERLQCSLCLIYVFHCFPFFGSSIPPGKDRWRNYTPMHLLVSSWPRILSHLFAGLSPLPSFPIFGKDRLIGGSLLFTIDLFDFAPHKFAAHTRLAESSCVSPKEVGHLRISNMFAGWNIHRKKKNIRSLAMMHFIHWTKVHKMLGNGISVAAWFIIICFIMRIMEETHWEYIANCSTCLNDSLQSKG